MNKEKYKGITWAKKEANDSYVFYPIWDWGLHDVWYYIFSNHLKYNKVYNYYFSQKPLQRCRVGSFVHPRCVSSLMEIREIYPDFYKKALERMENINSTIQTHDMIHEYIVDLPKYFANWDEYVVYLAENLIKDDKSKDSVIKLWKYSLNRYMSKVGEWQEGKSHVEKHLGIYAASSIIDGSYDLIQMKQEESRIFTYIGKHESEIREANKRRV